MGAGGGAAAFAGGQALKKKAGVFGAVSGTTIWLFVINADAANAILYTSRTGTTWTPWNVVPGTDVGLHNRQFLSGTTVQLNATAPTGDRWNLAVVEIRAK